MKWWFQGLVAKFRSAVGLKPARRHRVLDEVDLGNRDDLLHMLVIESAEAFARAFLVTIDWEERTPQERAHIVSQVVQQADLVDVIGDVLTTYERKQDQQASHRYRQDGGHRPSGPKGIT